MKTMRRLFFFILLPLIVLGFCFFKNSASSVDSPIDSYNIAFKTDDSLIDKEFLIVVISNRESPLLEKNLDSIFTQEYNRYRILYLTNTSIDAPLAYAKEKGMGDRITVLCYKDLLNTLHNATTSIDNDKIIILLDGEDWLYHSQVLTNLNLYYQNDLIWMTYGQYIIAPEMKIEVDTPSAPLQKGEVLNIRQNIANQWKLNQKFNPINWPAKCCGPLRTFYAGLFKRIKQEDLLADKSFYPTRDLSVMIPMLEMAQEHCYFTNILSYVYNNEKPINTSIELETMNKLIHMGRYSKLTTHPKDPISE